MRITMGNLYNFYYKQLFFHNIFRPYFVFISGALNVSSRDLRREAEISSQAGPGEWSKVGAKYFAWNFDF